jgi:L-threonylcarbamoyladenylate synthase
VARIIKADFDGLTVAAKVVGKGGLICFPTDTVYGLGCNPLNSSAVNRARLAKGVPTRPFPVLVKGIENAELLAQMSDRARKVARKFWPGPLTLVLPAREILPRNLVPDGTVGLRSPNHSICLNLLSLCSGALVGTSANATGRPPAVSAEEAARVLGDNVDLILDGGRAPLGLASTVVSLTKPTFAIVREGPIGAQEIMKCLRERNHDAT